MKLFIEYLDNKFINNILSSKINQNISILSSELNNDLYKFHDKYNPDCYILSAKNINSNNKEILQFINEYSSKIKIIFYHENKTTIDFCLTNSSLSDILHIGYEDIDHSKYKKIPYLLNRDLFFNRNIKHRNSKIICFIDNIEILPNDLNKLLYPNTKLSIILFGNIIHPQCLGKITEPEKSIILNNYEYYLSINENYLLEASECGCKIFTTQSILESKAMVDIDTSNILDYSQFIESLISQ